MARRQRRFRMRCRSQVDARFDNQQEDAATLLVSMQHDGMFNTGDFSCELPDKTGVHISGHQDSSRWNIEECFESWQKSFRVTCMKSGKKSRRAEIGAKVVSRAAKSRDRQGATNTNHMSD